MNSEWRATTRKKKKRDSGNTKEYWDINNFGDSRKKAKRNGRKVEIVWMGAMHLFPVTLTLAPPPFCSTCIKPVPFFLSFFLSFFSFFFSFSTSPFHSSARPPYRYISLIYICSTSFSCISFSVSVNIFSVSSGARYLGDGCTSTTSSFLRLALVCVCVCVYK